MNNRPHLLETLRSQPVVPVLSIASPDMAVAVARALVGQGIRVLEWTLRTPRALEVIAVVRDEIPEAVAAVGTVLDAATARAAVEAGGQILFSPGTDPGLMAAAESLGVPLIPGVATATEIMAARARGLRVQKFFPAEASGGVAALRALAGPFPDVKFCPTGGINEANLAAYLGVPNVVCVGGSWLVSHEDICAGDFGSVGERAARAFQIARDAGWVAE